jgi:hypothetical protein
MAVFRVVFPFSVLVGLLASRNIIDDAFFNLNAVRTRTERPRGATQNNMQRNW